MTKNFLSPEEFKSIFTRVPRLCVDLLIFRNNKILLTKRSIEPSKGFWHIPGAGVLYQERIEEAIARVARTELGVEVNPEKFLGYIEYMKDGFRHGVSLVFKCKIKGKKEPMPLEQASEVAFFDTPPQKMPPEQKDFVLKLEKVFTKNKNQKSLFSG